VTDEIGSGLSMKWDPISLAHRAHFAAKAATGVARRSALPWAVVTLLGWMLAACASFTGADGTDTPSAAHREPAAPALPQDGPVFEGSAPGVPGSSAKLVLERNFQQTRKLRWESVDARIGATEVDFFEPREWELKGDPPETLSFSDRSPGPILFGRILLAPYNRAVVNVVLGQDRVTYTLDRVKRDGTH
jgi:hypothetical protein